MFNVNTPDDDRGRWSGTCRAVVVGGVDIEHGVQLGVGTGQPGVSEQRGLVKPAHVDFLEKVRGAHPLRLDQLLDPRREVGAVAGGHRLPVAADNGQHHVRGCLRLTRRGCGVEPAEHCGHEGRVQEGQVGGADEGHGGVPGRGGQSDSQALHRPPAFLRVGVDQHLRVEGGQLLSRGTHDDHRTVDRATDDARYVAQQGRAVPLKRRLGGAHPRRAAPGKHDTGRWCRTVEGVRPVIGCHGGLTSLRTRWRCRCRCLAEPGCRLSGRDTRDGRQSKSCSAAVTALNTP